MKVPNVIGSKLFQRYHQAIMGYRHDRSHKPEQILKNRV